MKERKKRVILTVILIVCLLLFCVPAAAYGETAGQRLVREAGFSVEWIDLGEEFASVRYLSFNGQDSEGLFTAYASFEDGTAKCVFINEKGERALPAVYDAAGYFENGYAYAEAGGKKMLIDVSGKELLDLTPYDFWASVGDTALFEVSSQGKAGLIDMAGIQLVPCEYKNFSALPNGLIRVTVWIGPGYKEGLFDRSGVAVTEPVFDSISDPGPGEEGLMPAERDGKAGFLNTLGEEAVPFQYEHTSPFSEGIAAVSSGGKWGAIDREGNTVIPFQFEELTSFPGGLTAINAEGKAGAVDLQGNTVIPFEYDSLEPVGEGTFQAFKILDGLYYNYFLDGTGKVLFGPKEYSLYPAEGRGGYIGRHYSFTGGLLPLSSYNTTTYALLDGSGNRLTPFYYDIGDFKEGMAPMVGGFPFWESGLLNQYGAVILPPVFDHLEIISGDTCLVQISDPAENSIDARENKRLGLLRLPADAATRKPSSGRPVTVQLDGLELYFDTEPVIAEGRVMVPLRKIFETLGAAVTWNEGEDRIRAVKGEGDSTVTVELTVGADSALINGKAAALDAPAVIQNGQTLVPLRFVSEAFGCEAAWDAGNRKVTVDRAGGVAVQ